MENVFSLFLILHIIGGIIGLLTGLLNVILKKGDKRHVLIGKCFAYSMLTAGVSALVLSIIHPNYFLFMVGVFTLYMVGTGNRYLYLKMLGKSQSPRPLDWLLTVVMLLAGLLFVGFGTWILIKPNLFGLVFITFGLFGLLFVRQDFRYYCSKEHPKNFWLLAHLQRMTGAFIAALTAFLVVNAQYFPAAIPGFVYWLLPTIIFTPLIVRWSNNIQAKSK